MLIPRRRLLVGAAAVAIAGRAAAALPVPESDVITFKVIREGDEIGHHSLRFTRDGDLLTVKVDVDIEVKLAFIPIFHYTHQNTERWQGDTFVGFDAVTNDNGKHYRTSASRQAAGINVRGTTIEAYTAPPSALAATHWNEHQLDGPMINPQDGKMLHPTIARDGMTNVALANGTAVAAEKFTLTGDMRLILWYGDRAAWTALQFKADDGSTVDYRLA